MKLGKYGEFLTGRSKAKEIADQFEGNILETTRIELDFHGVQSFAQSFCSELLFQLMEQGFDLKKLTWVRVPHTQWQDRLQSEISFLSNLPEASGQ